MVKPNSEKIRDFEIAYQHTCHTLCNTRLKIEPKLQSKLKINNKQKKTSWILSASASGNLTKYME